MLRFLLTLILMPVLLRAQPADYAAYYNFNRATTEDETGRNNARASGASFVEDRFGNSRSACFLHGNPGSYLNLGTSPLLKPVKGSVSIWVNIDIIVYSGRGLLGNPIILTKSRSSDDFYEGYSLAYDYSDQKIVGSTSQSEQEQRILHSNNKMSLHDWHHLVFTYDNDFACLYLDGRLEIKIKKDFQTRFLETDSVVVGSTANVKNYRFLCGTVDDIAIYDRVISQDEVTALYNAPNPNRNSIYLTWAGIIALILTVMALVIWLIVRLQKRRFEKEKEQSRISSKMLELETKAIRSQMNPHFVFNSFNTLMRFILEEDFANSHLYLTKFSTLMRKLLESSSSEMITLTEEIHILNLYVEIEKLRFSNLFEFEIVSDVLLPGETYIPFMLVQPFAENAIWHGLLHKEGSCQLQITFSDVDAQSLKCVVEDNGIGRNPLAAGNTSLGKKSMGIDLIRQRLALLEKATSIPCRLVITDKLDKHTGAATGTRVEIIIPKLSL